MQQFKWNCFDCRISPLGVAFLIAAKIIEMESIAATIQSLGWYFITVMIGLFLHGFGKIMPLATFELISEILILNRFQAQLQSSSFWARVACRIAS